MIDRMKLRAQLSKHEGRRQFAYDDASGKTIGEGSFVRGLPTVGVGRNLYGKGLSEDEIDYLLDNDITDAMRDASTLPAFAKLDPVRQAVLVELVFNMGLARVKEFKKFLNFANEGRWAHAAEELKDSLWYRQVKSRADTLIEQFKTGQWQ